MNVKLVVVFGCVNLKDHRCIYIIFAIIDSIIFISTKSLKDFMSGFSDKLLFSCVFKFLYFIINIQNKIWTKRKELRIHPF